MDLEFSATRSQRAAVEEDDKMATILTRGSAKFMPSPQPDRQKMAYLQPSVARLAPLNYHIRIG